MSDLIASLSCKTGDAVKRLILCPMKYSKKCPVKFDNFSLNAFSKSLFGQVINGSVGQRF